MKLRIHQEKARLIAQEIANGTIDRKETLAYVTPGGGKTLLASIFAHELVSRDDVDYVLVICPRDALRSQMRDGWTNEGLDLSGGLMIDNGSRRSLLKKERMGYVTTYQYVATNPGHWEKVMKDGRWLVILDESHHLPAGTSADAIEARWTQTVAPIVTAAKRVLLMTGTLVRDKREPLAFVTYDETRAPRVDIRYTRRDALDEGAVLNVSVKLSDGDATYWHKFSKQKHALATVSAAEESRARRTLLTDPAYRDAMLGGAIEEWARYRDTQNPVSRMIVICEAINSARVIRNYIRDHFKWRVVLATSDEREAARNLARFRDSREGDILVTVNMAYEGLDVPDCTHMVCLTNIRSRPWLEQAFSRVTRFDRKCGLPWAEQCAYLYVPLDPSMVSFLAEWIEEQDARYDDQLAKAGASPKPRGSTFRPESGEMTGQKFADTYGIFSEADQSRIRRFRVKYPELVGIPTAHVLKVARDMWPNDASVVESIHGAAE